MYGYRDNGLRTARDRREFDFDRITVVRHNNGAEVSSAQSGVGEVVDQYDRIEFSESTHRVSS